MIKDNSNKLASCLLKAELKRNNMTYEQLAFLLTSCGTVETQSSIVSKMKRGKFQFAFFLECLHVMGIKHITLNISETAY